VKIKYADFQQPALSRTLPAIVTSQDTLRDVSVGLVRPVAIAPGRNTETNCRMLGRLTRAPLQQSSAKASSGGAADEGRRGYHCPTLRRAPEPRTAMDERANAYLQHVRRTENAWRCA
jgi:hypothetical protein